MARITIQVPAFKYTFECVATDEDEAWESINSDDIAEIAIEKATVVDSETTYDEPDEPDNEPDPDEDEEYEEKA